MAGPGPPTPLECVAMIQAIADAVFMPWVVGTLLSAGLFLTLRLGFVQVRRFPAALQAMFA